MRPKRSPRHQGIEIRHSRSCGHRRGSDCDCKPTYQASVYSRRDKKVIKKTFPTLSAAKAWRQDSQVAVRRGTMRSPTRRTLAETVEAWLVGAKGHVIRNRSGDPYRPSTLRSYELSLRKHVLRELGHIRLSELTRQLIQEFADDLAARELSASTIRNTINPLRAICRRALNRGEIAVDPTSGLELPAVRGKRERIATPAEAAALLAALEPRDRPVWACALHAGLRLGELRALRWDDLDLDGRQIRVRRSWDPKAGPLDPKTAAGRRIVPMSELLHAVLGPRNPRGSATGLVFGANGRPFDGNAVRNRARKAWAAAGLAPIGFHEARHTFASHMIAAGVNLKAVSTYLGHSGIQITLDRYGHLLPGSEAEAAALLNVFLEDRAAQQD